MKTSNKSTTTAKPQEASVESDLLRSGSFQWSVRLAEWLLIGLLAVVPFHAFVTVWGASFGLNYDLLRVWSLPVVVGLFGLSMYWLWRDATLRQWLLGSFLFRSVIIFVFLTLIIGSRGVMFGDVSVGAFLIGMWLNLRFLVVFGVAILLLRYSKRSINSYVKLVIGAAVVVAAFAVLQYFVLPTDFLKHFGYGASTIEPVQTINSNDSYIRVISTTRGANPLGAYMLVVVSLVAALLIRSRNRLAWMFSGGLMAAALFFSFSRSAWLGTFIAVLFLVGVWIQKNRNWKPAALSAFVFLLLFGAVFIASGSNHTLQNIIYHTDTNSEIKVSSNDERADALEEAALEVMTDPLGDGVGSAGPASVHNQNGDVKIAENYYLQIGQELGWFGLISFTSILVAVGFQLWKQRKDSVSIGLLAAFIGLVFVNMLQHAWIDDTLAFTWWTLAGLAVGAHLWRSHSKSLTKKTK